MKQYTGETICELTTKAELQRHLLDILLTFDSFCTENNLKYYLSGGTLLGAIRHHGFIPWDDDIDVNMSRPDCERLAELASEGRIGPYILSAPNCSDLYHAYHWKLFDESLLVRKANAEGRMNAKIYPAFIDIFPIDGLPEDEEECKAFYDNLKELKSEERETFRNKRTEEEKQAAYDKVVRAQLTYSFDASEYVGVTSTNVHNEEERVSKREFCTPIRVDFEGYQFNAPGCYDRYLRQLYGENYMDIPPVEQRETHRLVPFNTYNEAELEAIKQQPKVSVILPVYNKAQYLDQTLDCLVNQTLDSYELIFVDDGSTDSTLSILRAAEAEHDFIRVITQQNQYAGVARNNGLKIARGEFVLFLDPDDFFELDLLEKLYNSAALEGTDMSVCGVNKYDEVTGKEDPARSLLRTELLPGSPLVAELIHDRLYNAFTFHSVNKLIRRSLLDNNEVLRYKPYYLSEDTWFTAMVLASVKTISYIDEALVHYRVNTGISLGDQIEEHMFASMKAYSEVKEYMDAHGFSEALKTSFVNKALKTSIDMMRKFGSFKAYTTYYNRMVFEGGFSSQGITAESIEGCKLLPGRYYRTFHAMMEAGSAEEFLYGDYVRLENRTKSLAKRLNHCEVVLYKTRDILNSTRNRLEVSNGKLERTKDELKRIKSSRSYKVMRRVRRLTGR